ncbi:hypothetical protein, partial [Mesorhizobium sp. M7A.F.Ca.CA.004.12.1.1]|uniref:hypothetical protein n=1 Tax=Mesorhizobium sp. M7A.F.Ca.CA.004.12.1.1 TaxID=2496732 RepID=UPI0019D074B5
SLLATPQDDEAMDVCANRRSMRSVLKELGAQRSPHDFGFLFLAPSLDRSLCDCEFFFQCLILGSEF